MIDIHTETSHWEFPQGIFWQQRQPQHLNGLECSGEVVRVQFSILSSRVKIGESLKAKIGRTYISRSNSSKHWVVWVYLLIDARVVTRFLPARSLPTGQPIDGWLPEPVHSDAKMSPRRLKGLTRRIKLGQTGLNWIKPEQKINPAYNPNSKVSRFNPLTPI